MKKSIIKPANILFVVFAVAFVILVPRIIPNQYMMTIIDNAIIYFIAILGLTVMLGMGGQVTFSLAGTMGIGAFTVAIATVRAHIHPLIAIVLAVVITSVFS